MQALSVIKKQGSPQGFPSVHLPNLSSRSLMQGRTQTSFGQVLFTRTTVGSAREGKKENANSRAHKIKWEHAF